MTINGTVNTGQFCIGVFSRYLIIKCRRNVLSAFFTALACTSRGSPITSFWSSRASWDTHDIFSCLRHRKMDYIFSRAHSFQISSPWFLSHLYLNSLMTWYFVQGFMESCLSESWSAPHPLAPPDILKSMHTSLDFLSQYDKVDNSPIPLHAYVNKMNWTVPPPNFYQWHRINNNYSIFCLF